MGDYSQYISRLLIFWRLAIVALVVVDYTNPEPATAAAKPLIAALSPVMALGVVCAWLLVSCGVTMVMSASERAAVLAFGDIVAAVVGCMAMPKSTAALLLFSLPALDLFSTGVAAVVGAAALSAAGFAGILLAEGVKSGPNDPAWVFGLIVMSLVCGLILQVQKRQEVQSQSVLSVIKTSQELGTSASLEKILGVAMRDIKNLSECSTCVIYLRDFNDPDSTMLRMVKAETPKLSSFVDFDMSQKKSILREVMDTKSATLLEDFNDYQEEEIIGHDPLFRSALVTPLLFETRALGALFVSHHKPRNYQVSMLHLLNMLASQLGVAVRNVQLQQTTETMAITDSMSGLFTHRHFQFTLDDEINESKHKSRQPLSLMLLDLDFFKKVNDTYGHPAGDALLKQMGSVLKQTCRPTDILCRYGGDEFTVIMPNTTQDEAVLIAERVRHEVEEYDFALGRQLVHVTLSGGVATFPQDGVDKRELINKADQAMYRAKQHGRNIIVRQNAGRKRFAEVDSEDGVRAPATEPSGPPVRGMAEEDAPSTPVPMRRRRQASSEGPPTQVAAGG